jgi:hypothetical protein
MKFFTGFLAGMAVLACLKLSLPMSIYVEVLDLIGKITLVAFGLIGIVFVVYIFVLAVKVTLEESITGRRLRSWLCDTQAP